MREELKVREVLHCIIMVIILLIKSIHRSREILQLSSRIYYKILVNTLRNISSLCETFVFRLVNIPFWPEHFLVYLATLSWVVLCPFLDLFQIFSVDIVLSISAPNPSPTHLVLFLFISVIPSTFHRIFHLNSLNSVNLLLP